LACASSRPSSCAFQPASSSRLPPTFQLCLRTCLQLAPPAVPGSAFVPISSLRLPSTVRPASRACLQLAPSTSLSGSAFKSASSLRLQPTFQPCLQTQPPTLIECLILRLAYGPFPACAFHQPYVLNLLAWSSTCVSDSALKPAFRSAWRLAPPAQPPAHLRTSLQLAPSFCRPAPLSF